MIRVHPVEHAGIEPLPRRHLWEPRPAFRRHRPHARRRCGLTPFVPPLPSLQAHRFRGAVPQLEQLRDQLGELAPVDLVQPLVSAIPRSSLAPPSGFRLRFLLTRPDRRRQRTLRAVTDRGRCALRLLPFRGERPVQRVDMRLAGPLGLVLLLPAPLVEGLAVLPVHPLGGIHLQVPVVRFDPGLRVQRRGKKSDNHPGQDPADHHSVHDLPRSPGLTGDVVDRFPHRADPPFAPPRGVSPPETAVPTTSRSRSARRFSRPRSLTSSRGVSGSR